MCLCVSEYVCLYVCVCVCVFVCLCVREREREREKAPRTFNRKTHDTCSSHIAEKYPYTHPPLSTIAEKSPPTHPPPSTHTHTDTHTPDQLCGTLACVTDPGGAPITARPI